MCRGEDIRCKAGQARAFHYYRKQHAIAWIFLFIFRKGSIIKVVEKCAKPFMIALHNIQFQRMLQFLLNLCFCTDQCWWTLHVITFHILLDQPEIPQENAMHSSLKSVEDAALTSEASHTCCVLVFSCHLTGTVSEI